MPFVAKCWPPATTGILETHPELMAKASESTISKCGKDTNMLYYQTLKQITYPWRLQLCRLTPNKAPKMDVKSNQSQRQVCQGSMHGFKAVLQIFRWSRCMSSWTFSKEEPEETTDELGRLHGGPLLDTHCLHPFASPKRSKPDPKPANFIPWN